MELPRGDLGHFSQANTIGKPFHRTGACANRVAAALLGDYGGGTRCLNRRVRALIRLVAARLLRVASIAVNIAKMSRAPRKSPATAAMRVARWRMNAGTRRSRIA